MITTPSGSREDGGCAALCCPPCAASDTPAASWDFIIHLKAPPSDLFGIWSLQTQCFKRLEQCPTVFIFGTTLHSTPILPGLRPTGTRVCLQQRGAYFLFLSSWSRRSSSSVTSTLKEEVLEFIRRLTRTYVRYCAVRKVEEGACIHPPVGIYLGRINWAVGMAFPPLSQPQVSWQSALNVQVSAYFMR